MVVFSFVPKPPKLDLITPVSSSRIWYASTHFIFRLFSSSTEYDCDRAEIPSRFKPGLEKVISVGEEILTPKRGYFISSFSSRSRLAIPSQLELTLTNVTNAGEEICYVSVGLDRSYFLSTRKGDGHYAYTNFPRLLKIIETCNMVDPSASVTIDQVRWLSFATDKEGYFACYVQDDGSERYGWEGLSESLEKALESYESISHLSMGHDGSWVILSKDKKPMWEGVPKDLEERLKQSDPIKKVILALDDKEEYFMEYEDGRTWMIIPHEWHPTVKPHLDDIDTDAITRALLADPVHQRALAAQRVACAAAVASAAQMSAMTTLRGMDDAADIATGTYRETEWRNTYRTDYDDGSDIAWM
ncbi:hypothetical protein FRB95_003329 [Tulasnella sp. JGI-2019a]|nr:hypothetical protein FRB95_003329 [Tulasnella sp. JGI-2019a]